MLTINNLEVKYGSQTALSIRQPITLQQGDRIGIIGSNGAGKTTLIKSVLGLNSYTGSILTELAPEEIAVHMQQNNYVSTMSVRSVMETILNTNIKKNKKVWDLIKFFEFEQCLSKKYTVLSGGQKQRMTIILVLCKDAPLVFFDEVTTGLDFETRQRLMEKMVDWYKEKDTTICIVSHYYEELEQLVDKLLILEAGKVVDFDKKEVLFHKYCGKTVITLENNNQNRNLVLDFPQLKASSHVIALSCKDMETEKRITDILIRENVNFKRSNCDIEIMFMNAKTQPSLHMGEGLLKGAMS